MSTTASRPLKSAGPGGEAASSESHAVQVDPRGPRFGAGITAVVLLAVVALGLADHPAAIWLLAYTVVMFAWGALATVARHPYGWLFKKLVRPRLQPPAELEDVRPPTFAQLVGLMVTGTGLVLALLGLPDAVWVSAAVAFVAAFLNAVFAYCLGCQMWVLLVRAKVIRA